MSRIATSRLDEIYSRQATLGWGPDYKPANQAVRGEAPAISRATRLQCPSLGRVVHLQSEPELVAALLALYNPALVGLQEQRILHPLPAPHPLATHPELRGKLLPPFRGTVEVMRCLDPKWTPAVREVRGFMVPVPYVGDLLLALRDDAGLYCVNWSVKSSARGFEEAPAEPVKLSRVGDGARDRLRRRQALEELYYSDVGIRTQRVTLEEVPRGLISNLRTLYQWQGRDAGLESGVHDEIVKHFQEALNNEVPPQLILGALAQKLGCSSYSALTILYQGIWAREIRVDLYLPILVNKPLNRERRDVLVHFASWFAR